MGSTSNSRNSLTTSTLDDDNMSALGDSRSPSTDGMRLGSRPLLNVSIPQDSRSTEEPTATQDNQDDHNDQDESVSFIVTSSSFIIVRHESTNSQLH